MKILVTGSGAQDATEDAARRTAVAYASQLRIWALVMCVVLAVTWVLPISYAAVIAGHAPATAAARLWRGYWWLGAAPALAAALLPPGWFRPGAWERGGDIYKPFGDGR
ncbi:MAG TPA: hypothetical protein VNZ06_10945, partial [Steroidobacteraceae bacterium]|nr:hypothetical protein [Steroidobacteraceae bacterium]